jgi:hypothetical protein
MPQVLLAGFRLAVAGTATLSDILFNRRSILNWHADRSAFKQIYIHPSLALKSPPVG